MDGFSQAQYGRNSAHHANLEVTIMSAVNNSQLLLKATQYLAKNQKSGYRGGEITGIVKMVIA